MNQHQRSVVAVLCLFLGVAIPAMAQSLPEPVPSSAKNLEWEGISLGILVDEVRTDAAAMGLKNFSVQVKDQTIEIVYRDIIFPPDSPKISKDTENKIVSLGKVLARFAGRSLLVGGHTAMIPGQEHDERSRVLSQDRAQAVVDVLATASSFTKEHLRAKGFGDLVPVSTTDISLNRRVEISVVESLDAVEPVAADAPAPAPAPQSSVWWKTQTDSGAPGYAVFFISDTDATDASVRAMLDRIGLPGLVVIVIDRGIVVIWDRSAFVSGTNDVDDATKKSLSELAGGSRPFGNVEARVGGLAGVDGETAHARQLAVARFLAEGSGLMAQAVLVGDEAAVFPAPAPEPVAVVPAVAVVEAAPAPVPAPVPAVAPAAAPVPVAAQPPAAPAPVPVAFNEVVECIDLTGYATLPLGRYGEFGIAGGGAGAGVVCKIPRAVPGTFASLWRFYLEVYGAGLAPNATSSVTELWELDGDLAIALRFRLLDGLTFALKPAYGASLHIMTATLYTTGSVRSMPYFDQALSLEGEFAVLLAGREGDFRAMHLLVVPGYHAFIEDSYWGQAATMRLGLRFGF